MTQKTLKALNDLWCAVIVGGEKVHAVSGQELEPGETGCDSCALCGRPEFLDCQPDCAAELARIAIDEAERETA